MKDILVGNVCGNMKNKKIKVLNIRNITIKTDDQTDSHDGTKTDDQTDFQDGISLWEYPFGDVNFWFLIAMLANALILFPIIGITAYCLNRLI